MNAKEIMIHTEKMLVEISEICSEAIVTKRARGEAERLLSAGGNAGI